MAKNAPFHIKSPVKNFHGQAKGGALHRAPLKYATDYKQANKRKKQETPILQTVSGLKGV